MNRIILSTLILAVAGTVYAANELQISYPTGATIIATVVNDAGQWFDTAGNAFETYNTLTDYDIAMTDQGNGEYRGTMDAGLPQGIYTVHFHASANVVPFAHHYNYNWSGTAKLGQPVDVSTLESRLTATRAGYLDELGPTNLPADIAAIPAGSATSVFAHSFASLGMTFEELVETWLFSHDGSQDGGN